MPAYPGHRSSFLWVNAALHLRVDGPDDADVGPLLPDEPPGDVGAARMRVNAHLRVRVMSPDESDVGPLPHRLAVQGLSSCVSRAVLLLGDVRDQGRVGPVGRQLSRPVSRRDEIKQKGDRMSVSTRVDRMNVSNSILTKELSSFSLNVFCVSEVTTQGTAAYILGSSSSALGSSSSALGSSLPNLESPLGRDRAPP
jgi:hypothetical protein